MYQDIDCLLLMFDLTSAASFEHLDAALSKFLSVHSHSQKPRPRRQKQHGALHIICTCKHRIHTLTTRSAD